MNFTDYSATLTVRRTVEVTDGPVMPMSSSVTGRTFRVQKITISYRFDEMTGGWILQFGGVKVSGVVLKKDGSDSLNHTDTSPYNFRETSSKWHWLTPIVDALTPVGKVALPTIYGTDA